MGVKGFLRKMKMTLSLGIPNSITNGGVFCFVLLVVVVIAVFVFSVCSEIFNYP